MGTEALNSYRSWLLSALLLPTLPCPPLSLPPVTSFAVGRPATILASGVFLRRSTCTERRYLPSDLRLYPTMVLFGGLFGHTWGGLTILLQTLRAAFSSGRCGVRSCLHPPSEIITGPSGLSGRIRGMKVGEEHVLADRKLAKNGGQVDELGACWMRRSISMTEYGLVATCA